MELLSRPRTLWRGVAHLLQFLFSEQLSTNAERFAGLSAHLRQHQEELGPISSSG
jgi:hypothetical protein